MPPGGHGGRFLVADRQTYDPEIYDYDLSDSARDALTREFLDSRAPDPGARFVCFEIDGTDPFANIGRQLEREVFFASWGNDADAMKAEYGPYDAASLFFLAIDTQEKTPAGVLRMIRNSPMGLKTIVDLDDSVKSPIAPVPIPSCEVMRHHGIADLDRCWDGATAAVPRPYRRKLSAIHLEVLGVVADALVRDDIQHFVSVLDAPVFRAARDILGLPLVPLAGTPPFTHMDAPDNQAVYAHVASLLTTAMSGNRRLGQKVKACVAGRTLPGLAPLRHG